MTGERRGRCGHAGVKKEGVQRSNDSRRFSRERRRRRCNDAGWIYVVV